MRALLIRTPHIEKILAGKKSWEIRGSKTNIRGRIGLIRNKSGTVVGICDLVDCRGPLSLEQYRRNAPKAGFKRSEISKKPYKNIYAWVLRNAQSLKTPVRYKHRPGAIIWVKLEARIERAIQKRLV